MTWAGAKSTHRNGLFWAGWVLLVGVGVASPAEAAPPTTPGNAVAPAGAGSATAAAAGASAAAGAEGQTKKKALTKSQEAAVEAELLKKLPSLAPIGDPHRVEQLWTLARQLTDRHAYCHAAERLRQIEKITGGTIVQNRGFAGQAFFMCARTRLSQGFVAEAADNLQRSIDIVGQRPEHRDMLFKLAIVRAKDGINRADIDTVRRSMAQAEKLGRDTGPGASNRVSEWALPILHATANEIAGWSRDLLAAGNRKMADQASKLALQYFPDDQIADGVRRDLILGGVVLPTVVIVAAVLLTIGLLWRLRRWLKLRRVAAQDDV